MQPHEIRDKIEARFRAAACQAMRESRHRAVRHLLSGTDAIKLQLARLGLERLEIESRAEQLRVLGAQFRGERLRCRDGHWTASPIRVRALREVRLAIYILHRRDRETARALRDAA